jgi:hypothetical protein
MMNRTWMAVVVALAAGCGNKSTSGTTPENRGGEGGPAAAGIGEEDFPDFTSEPFEVDVDGDGAADKVSFSCDGEMNLRVGAWSGGSPAMEGMDVMSCDAAAVAMGGAGRQVIVRANQHEEEGPPYHVMFALVDGELTVVWDGQGELLMHQRGWKLATTECDEEAAAFIVRTTTYTLNGRSVDSSEAEDRQPLEGQCDGP